MKWRVTNVDMVEEISRQCKGPVAELCLWFSREASMAGVMWNRDEVVTG